jgi:hypothetical protein
MTDTVAAVNLFRVDGLIAVITGGGTGLNVVHPLDPIIDDEFQVSAP